MKYTYKVLLTISLLPLTLHPQQHDNSARFSQAALMAFPLALTAYKIKQAYAENKILYHDYKASAHNSMSHIQEQRLQEIIQEHPSIEAQNDYFKKYCLDTFEHTLKGFNCTTLKKQLQHIEAISSAVKKNRHYKKLFLTLGYSIMALNHYLYQSKDTITLQSLTDDEYAIFVPLLQTSIKHQDITRLPLLRFKEQDSPHDDVVRFVANGNPTYPIISIVTKDPKGYFGLILESYKKYIHDKSLYGKIQNHIHDYTNPHNKKYLETYPLESKIILFDALFLTFIASISHENAHNKNKDRTLETALAYKQLLQTSIITALAYAATTYSKQWGIVANIGMGALGTCALQWRHMRTYAHARINQEIVADKHIPPVPLVLWNEAHRYRYFAEEENRWWLFQLNRYAESKKNSTLKNHTDLSRYLLSIIINDYCNQTHPSHQDRYKSFFKRYLAASRTPEHASFKHIVHERSVDRHLAI